MGNAILGMCSGYTGAQVEPFLRTCRSHFGGDIVLFVFNCDQTLKDLAQFYSVKAVHVASCENPVVERFQFYYDYILENKGVKSCLMIDVRDVVFQGDPFTQNIRSQHIRFYEEESLFRDIPAVCSWSSAVYGYQEAQSLIDMPIICAGATLAGRDGALEYTRKMIVEIERSPTKKFGTDQAIHNHLYYSNALSSCESVKHGYGEVQNLIEQKLFVFNPEGILLNRDGSVPSVIHQYDRHKFLIQHFAASEVILSRKDANRLRKLDRSGIASLKHFIRVSLGISKTSKRLPVASSSGRQAGMGINEHR